MTRTPHFLPLSALLLVSSSVAPSPLRADAVQVEMLHVADQGSLDVSVVRATRGAGPSATVVVVLQGPRGDRLFLRRSQPEPGMTVHEYWLGRPPAVVLTRRPNQPVLLESGGLSMRFLESDLGRPTVDCWVSALVSKVDPLLLAGAAGIRALKDWAGIGSLGDVFYPATVLWQVGGPAPGAPRGAPAVTKGPFRGEPWDFLSRAAVEELGKS